MFSVLARPEAEAVVVFRRQDQSFHPRGFGDRYDLAGIEGGGIEDLFVLVAVAPFLVRKGVHREMEEPVEFHRVPAQLPLAWHRAVGGGRQNGTVRRTGSGLANRQEATAKEDNEKQSPAINLKLGAHTRGFTANSLMIRLNRLHFVTAFLQCGDAERGGTCAAERSHDWRASVDGGGANADLISARCLT